VDPAKKGTENVLNAVNKTDTVKRVVLTSSVAGMMVVVVVRRGGGGGVKVMSILVAYHAEGGSVCALFFVLYVMG